MNPYNSAQYDTITTIGVYKDTVEVTKTPNRTFVTKATINSVELVLKNNVKIGMYYDEFKANTPELQDDSQSYSIISFENSSQSKWIKLTFSPSEQKLINILYLLNLD